MDQDRAEERMIVFILLILGTLQGASIRCDNERDCHRFNTFCHGPHVCNQSAWCSPQNIAYDPCRQLRDYALSFSRDSGGQHVVSILCMEELRQCVELYYCVVDEDCDDGLFCNGRERCVQGECRGVTTAVCKSCDESTRCGTGMSVKAMASDTTVEAANIDTVYAIVGLSVITVALIVLFVIILIFRSNFIGV